MNSNEMIWIDLPSLQSIELGENALLPNLTSIINSEGSSFCNPRSVTLESISEYWIMIVFRYSKSSKCQAALFTQESLSSYCQ